MGAEHILQTNTPLVSELLRLSTSVCAVDALLLVDPVQRGVTVCWREEEYNQPEIIQQNAVTNILQPQNHETIIILVQMEPIVWLLKQLRVFAYQRLLPSKTALNVPNADNMLKRHIKVGACYAGPLLKHQQVWEVHEWKHCTCTSSRKHKSWTGELVKFTSAAGSSSCAATIRQFTLDSNVSIFFFFSKSHSFCLCYHREQSHASTSTTVSQGSTGAHKKTTWSSPFNSNVF